MAKSSTVVMTIPKPEYKPEFDFGNPEDAFSAVGEAGREAKIYRVPMENIHPVGDFNIRIHDAGYEAHLDSIATSILDNGFFQHRPLKVFVNKEGDLNLFMLADGYTRYNAAKRAVEKGAKINRLPVVVVPKGTSLDDLMIGLDADNDSRPLAPFEKAILAKRLQHLDNDEDEIASKLRISKQYVNDLLAIMAAPKALHNMITSGEVALQLASNLIKEHGSAKKALDALRGAGATGESATPPIGPDGKPTTPANRVTRTTVANSGGTAQAGKRLYEALVEYMIVLGTNSGGQAAYDFLVRWNQKEPDAVKELAKIAGKKETKGKAKKNPKDVRIKITDDMTEEDKVSARAHNKNVKKRKERREAKEAAAASAGKPVDNNEV